MDRKASFARVSVPSLEEIEEFLVEEECLLCNCATCGQVLLSIESNMKLANNVRAKSIRRHLPPSMAARVNRRPYCSKCLQYQG